MSSAEILVAENKGSIAKLPFLAALVALVGLGDSIYLTVHHYTAEPVPCSILTGCEQVLTSKYATLGGIVETLSAVPSLAAIPLALLGALAYLTAFLLAAVSIRGNRSAWLLFGAQVVVMALFSAWLFYLQAVVIEAFCQFCLLSAGTTLTLLIIFIISKFFIKKA